MLGDALVRYTTGDGGDTPSGDSSVPVLLLLAPTPPTRAIDKDFRDAPSSLTGLESKSLGDTTCQSPGVLGVPAAV